MGNNTSTKQLVNNSAKFGTLPVFLTALSTILGAILFLRFGWAVGQVGLLGVIGIILLGHLVTIPTAMAVAEIATNQRVRGGGAYFIISRSFGLNIGAAIGIALFLSQAISVAFYVIAFGEAFDPVISWLATDYDFVIADKRFITVPLMAILSVLMLFKGADIGVKALYVVVAVLLASLGCFFLGKPLESGGAIDLHNFVQNGENYFFVFTIVFPAFTGLAAGLGLSGDLKEPEKAIPNGTILATIVGLLVYVFAAFKFSMSASPEELVADQLIMEKISIWGPIIPIGLAAASLSSALGSIMIAPRTLQAIGMDNIFSSDRLNEWMARGRKSDGEPINGSIVTIAIAFLFIVVGDVDFVAQIISMFFMITYGAICLISLLEHFAADPAYRPTFKSHWSISFIGTVASFWLMFKMNLPYAALSLGLMGVLYFAITRSKKEKRGFNKLFRGVVFQLARELQIFAQRADREDRDVSWRPFAICISPDTFVRRSGFEFMRWMASKYGFGTYIHFIKGFLNKETHAESKDALKRLLKLSTANRNRLYLDTIISPSYTSAIAQVVQLSGISGKGNNLILFEFSRDKPETITDAISNYELMTNAGFDICLLNTSYKGFGDRRDLHIWISPEDYRNANLMILLGFILLGHPDWKNANIKIFALAKQERIDEQREKLVTLIKEGRIPVSPSNVEMVPFAENENRKEIISQRSVDADLTILGFRTFKLKEEGISGFNGYGDLGNILFVSANRKKEIR